MIRVLIVEDDPMVAKINRNYIESVDGFMVVSIATNYIEAINILKCNNIDLVLLDIYLPKGDGISILKEMRKKQFRCDVIMVTASAEIEKIDSALRLGVFDYLIKPFEYERLRRSLEDYQTRFQVLKLKEDIKQRDLDKLFLYGNSGESKTLQKGLNKLTLNRVIKFMDKNQDKLLTAEEISDELGLTKVTIRRYMDYLESIGFIVRDIEYGAVGRPLYKYKKVNNTR